MARTAAENIGEAMRRSLPHLPAEARSTVEGMLSPASLALISVTLAVWAGSHFFGVGEVVDVVLAVAGVFTLGWAVFEGAREMYVFAKLAVNATSEDELEQAGRHFARAVTLLGVSTVQALLLRGQVRALRTRGRPRIHGSIEVTEPPPAGGQLRLSRPQTLPDGSLGITDEYGVIAVSRNQALNEQRLTLYHELVHRWFSPKTGPLRRLRAELVISRYARSALLRYLEEGFAEGYAQMRVSGISDGFSAYRFPIDHGYVTVSALRAEGAAIGTILLGGATFYVSISRGPLSVSQP